MIEVTTKTGSKLTPEQWRHRYLNDPNFNAFVHLIEGTALELGYDTDDMESAAAIASVNMGYRLRRIETGGNPLITPFDIFCEEDNEDGQLD